MGTLDVIDPLLLMPVCWVGFLTCLWLVVVVVYMKKFHKEEDEAPEDGQVYGNSDTLADAAVEDETGWVPEQSFATEGALEEQPERMCVSLERVLVMALECGCTGQPEDDSAEAVKKQQEGLAAAAEPEQQQIEVVVPDDFFFGVAAKNRMPKLATAFDAKPQPMPRLYTAFGRENKLA